MMNAKKGSMTIFLAMTMFVFLLFFLVLIEGTRIYYLRAKAVQALELTEFSVLSEYQKELFENYGLFFLDLDYEQGSEHQGILEQKAQLYLSKNAEELETVGLRAEEFCRAADGDGSAFFRQAVEFTKLSDGYGVFEELLDSVNEEQVELEKLLEGTRDTIEEFLEESAKKDGMPLLQIDLPEISFPSIEALTSSVFGSDKEFSQKGISLQECLLERELSVGSGKKEEILPTDMQLFHQYIFRHFCFYGAENSNSPKESLEYQLEYIIAGQDSDFRNLENVMWRIFLLRAGGNYLFYHRDETSVGKAQAEAVALVGFTGNTVLVEAVKELLFIIRAVEEGIEDTKNIFAGQKVPLYQEGIFAGAELGYQEYLYLFLHMTDTREKIYRCMDLVELEVRKKSGYEQFRLDHCTDCFTLQWRYTFAGLFTEWSSFQGKIYENTITRKIYYEN